MYVLRVTVEKLVLARLTARSSELLVLMHFVSAIAIVLCPLCVIWRPLAIDIINFSKTDISFNQTWHEA